MAMTIDANYNYSFLSFKQFNRALISSYIDYVVMN